MPSEEEAAEDQVWAQFASELPASDQILSADTSFKDDQFFAIRQRRNGVVPCGMPIPDPVWGDYVLPHRFIDESWSPWRQILSDRFSDRAQRAASIEDAVMMLNTLAFTELGIRYHPTKRPHNNMNVAECIACGFASCTGLSILLAAACRAVGIPARLAGVQAWSDGSGNHTWVEVWDHGQWRVVAAAESFRYNETWFNDKARNETIFAVSYKPTSEPFPLAWTSSLAPWGIDVSARYQSLPQTSTNPCSIVIEPRHYICPHIEADFELSGKLDHSAWAAAEWTEYFVDIEGSLKPPPRFHTRAKVLYSDTTLYVGAMLEDPHVWGTLTEKNSIIFNDPDFEVFIDPDGDGHHYYEFEVNALGTIWELYVERPYRDQGPVHRGRNLTGLRSQVHVHGHVNNPSVQDTGWSVEIAIPLAELCAMTGSERPRAGAQWRLNFSRVHWMADIIDSAYRKVPREAHAEDNWVWSPQQAIDMHRPEQWGVLQFGGDSYEDDGSWPARELLAELYYRSRELPGQRLSQSDLPRLDPRIAKVNLQSGQGIAEVALDNGRRYTMSADGRFFELF